MASWPWFGPFRPAPTPVSKSDQPKPRRPRCWRIQRIPERWTKDFLIERLQDLVISKSLDTLDEDQLSLYPACSDKGQTGILDLRGPCKYFDDLKTDDSNTVRISEATSEEKTYTDLIVDCQFYGFTPLNTPKGENIIE